MMSPPPIRRVKRRVRRAARKAAHALRRRLLGRRSVGVGPNENGSSACLAKALGERGIGHAYMSGNWTPLGSMPHHKFLAFRINGVAYYYSMRGILFVTDADGSVRRATDEAVAELLSHKNLTNSILRRHGFSAPEGLAVHRDALAEACAFLPAFLALVPDGVCVKPADGRKGQKVYVGVRDLPSFVSAFTAVARASDQVLIEESVPGAVYRFLCVAGRVVAIRYGVPASVEGDGEQSVAELLATKNRERASSPFAKAIRLTGPGRRLLEAQGMSLASIPKAGETVWLSRMSNLDQGAEIVDATESLHPSYIALVERAMQCFPGLILCGADVAIENASVPATNANHHFIELNEGPGFEAHHFPTIGKPRDVAGAIVDYLMTRR